MSKEISLTQQIKSIIQQADKYQYLISDEEDHFTNLLREIAINLSKEAYVAGGNGGHYDEGLGGMNYEFSEENWNEFIEDKI